MAKRLKKTAYVRCRGGSISCKYGCIGCGMCVSACHFAAISLTDGGVPEVDREKCVGCGLCVRSCPQKLIDIILPDSNIQPKCSNRDYGKAAAGACVNSCIACGICEKACPAAAIRIDKGRPVIDASACICCGMCAVRCPRGVIRDSNGIMTAE